MSIAEQARPGEGPDPTVRVLLVEDEPADARLIEEALAALGEARFEIDWCDELKTAIGHLDADEYDVVLLDLNLPDARGIETFERVRFVAPDLPVVVMCGDDDPDLALAMVRAGAQDCLIKGDIKEVALARALRYAVERTRAQRAVKDAERRYRSLFHAGLEGIALIDEGRFLDVNEAFTRIFRERRTNLIGRPVVELVSEAAHAGFPDRLARASGAPFETTARRGDGVPIEVLFVVRPHVHQGRKCLILVARDVTRARETERRLADNERWFRTIAEQASDILMVMAPDGRHTFVSPAVERLLGRPPGDLLGRTPYGLVHPDDHTRVKERFTRALAEPDGELKVRYRMRHRDGHLVDVEARGVNRSGDRTVRGMIVSIRDISDQIRVEAALRDSEHRFRTLFENATVGLYRSTPDGRILLVNPALAQMTGFSDPGEVMGRNVEEDDLVGPLYDRRAWVAEMEAHGRVIGRESPWRRKDGSTLWVRESATTVRGADGEVRFFEGVVEDITDQKDAEQEIRVQKTLLEAQQEASTDGIVVVDRLGRVVSANTRFVDMWGLAGEDVREADATEVLERMRARAEDPEAFQVSVLALARDKDEAIRDEVRLADGTVLERYSTPLLGPDGAHYGRAWFFHDSTDRIRTEALLARLADQQKMVLDAAGEGIFGLNLKGNISFVNPAAARLLGRSTKDLIGRPAHILFEPHRRPKDGASSTGEDVSVLGPLRDGEVHERTDDRFLRADGTTIPVDLVCTPLREHGRIVGSVVVFSDITHRKRAEEKFRSLLETAPDPMVIFDSDGRIVLVNEQVRRVFGHTADDLLGRHVGVLAPVRMGTDHPLVRAVGGSLATLEATAAHEVRVRRADGSEFSADISLSPLRTEDGVLVITAIRDITDRLVAEEALRQRSEEMEAFAYAVSHDLRTPLVSLDWLVEELRDTLEDDESDQQDLIRRIHRNIESMDDLVNALLDLARIGQDESEGDLATDLTDVVADVVDGLGEECARRGIVLEYEPGALPVVRADPVRMQQVFSNLIGNAVKFVEDQVGEVHVRARRQIAGTGSSMWRIEVEDNGPGVPSDHKERIFRLFERAPDPLGRPISGTGVGLALARKVVRHYGGELGVRDAPGGGSVFFLDLPGEAMEGETRGHPAAFRDTRGYGTDTAGRTS